jgi:hypothetical protein
MILKIVDRGIIKMGKCKKEENERKEKGTSKVKRVKYM